MAGIKMNAGRTAAFDVGDVGVHDADGLDEWHLVTSFRVFHVCLRSECCCVFVAFGSHIWRAALVIYRSGFAKRIDLRDRA